MATRKGSIKIYAFPRPSLNVMIGSPMFENLTEKLSNVLRSLGGKSKLTEDNISDALTEVRKALLSADVHFKVAERIY